MGVICGCCFKIATFWWSNIPTITMAPSSLVQQMLQHVRVSISIPCTLWSSSPHVIIPYAQTPLHMLPSSGKPTPPLQLSVPAAGLLNWMWSLALGCALLCAPPNWSQWRFSRRTLSPVVLRSRAQRSIIFSGGFTPPRLCASAGDRCAWVCVFLLP